jgi:hypothetical protein
MPVPRPVAKKVVARQPYQHLLMFAYVAKPSLCTVGIGETPCANMTFDGRDNGYRKAGKQLVPVGIFKNR